MGVLKTLLFFISIVIVDSVLVAQSALTMTGGASLSVEENTVLTVQGNFLASAGIDTVSISPRGKIEITENWNNQSNGRVVDLSTGNIEFNGSRLQEIIGNNAFNNLIINNTAGVLIRSGSLNLNNELELLRGNLETDGLLTLMSNASKTARIAPILTGSISGDVTIQTFIENAAYDYRFLSMPIMNKTLADWSDDFLMTGFTGTPFPTFSFNSILYYNETLSGNRNARYENATTINDQIAVGVGVQAYLGAADIMVDATGEIYSGTISFPVSFTDDPTQSIDEDGWNLIGNPYPSTIDWNSTAWVKDNLNDAIYIYEGSNNAYRTYVNGVGTNGGSQYIPSSQAFWVKATNTPRLIGNELVKSAREIGFIEQNTKQEIIRLSLSDQNYSDEIVVRMHDETTSNFDAGWDAYKFKGSIAQPILTAIQDSVEYSILSTPLDSSTLPIYLTAEVPSSGYYNLNVGELPTDVHCIFLEDLFTGRIESLRDSSMFRFLLSDTTTISRFRLTVSKVADYQLTNAFCYGDSTFLDVSSKTGNPVNITWYSSPSFFTQVDSNQLTKRYNLTDGVYYFNTDLEGCVTQSDTFVVTSPTVITSQIISNPDSGFATGNTSINIKGGTTPYQITWNTSPQQQGLSAVGLAAGQYFVNVIDGNGCILTDSVYIDGLTTSIETVSQLDGIIAYPNPVIDKVHLKGFENLTLDYKLLDALGREVAVGRADRNGFTIDMSSLQSGVYFLQLINKEEYKLFRIKKI